ncbi:MAG: hypothetical protein ABIF17_04310 [Patescibacteria group bacterium]
MNIKISAYLSKKHADTQMREIATVGVRQKIAKVVSKSTPVGRFDDEKPGNPVGRPPKKK